MTDTRALTEDEREAMERAYENEMCAAWANRQSDHDSDEGPWEEAWIAARDYYAGLRYRDGAEPSEAEVEAAILAAYNDQPQWFGGTMTRPSDRRPKTFEECYGCAPLEHAESRRDVELILKAAKQARKASP